ncbi:MAG: hypothetical protein EVG15_01440 [Candidatus Acididesulfobacter diazotrophicus]|uniref:Uncharacterized protein n=1 Tax=Candidatus Acididesulfobacter diazotrophicus TaxID=2597226 RepID=A0A519BQL3_9DELT|nr:MAG: hypothetical protein EVG15_01440 [Candidatus Acididesulfobacter diazotrophicus]
MSNFFLTTSACRATATSWATSFAFVLHEYLSVSLFIDLKLAPEDISAFVNSHKKLCGFLYVKFV